MNFFSSLFSFLANLFRRPTAPDLVLSDGVTTVKASAKFGGAIYSLMWRGTEFIDASDRGRLLKITTIAPKQTTANASTPASVDHSNAERVATAWSASDQPSASGVSPYWSSRPTPQI